MRCAELGFSVLISGVGLVPLTTLMTFSLVERVTLSLSRRVTRGTGADSLRSVTGNFRIGDGAAGCGALRSILGDM